MSLDRGSKLDDLDYQMGRCADSLDEIKKLLATVVSLLRKLEKRK